MAGCPPYSLVVEFSPMFRDILLLTPRRCRGPVQVCVDGEVQVLTPDAHYTARDETTTALVATNIDDDNDK